MQYEKQHSFINVGMYIYMKEYGNKTKCKKLLTHLQEVRNALISHTSINQKIEVRKYLIR